MCIYVHVSWKLERRGGSEKNSLRRWTHTLISIYIYIYTYIYTQGHRKGEGKEEIVSNNG